MTHLEDRVNPVASVSVASLGDITETGSASAFRFTRSDNADSSSVSLNVSGSASSGIDYSYMPVAFFSSGGALTIDVSITPTNDSSVEGTETIIFTLVSGAQYTIGTGTATMNLYDDDTAQVSVAKQGSDPTEGGNGTFRITRTGSMSGNLTVNFATGGSATSGTDYTSIGTSATITSGNSYVDVTVTTLADNLVEGDESASIQLTDGGATYSAYGSSAFAALAIDDDPPIVSVSLVSDAVEGGTDGEIRISRTGGDTSSEIEVFYFVPGSATSATDYTALSGEVTIPENDSYVDIQVEVEAIDDSTADADETVKVVLEPDSNYILAGAYDAELLIHDSSTGSVTGRAFDDLDSDGIQDSGEGGLSDVGVELYNDAVLVATTTTDGHGAYRFIGLAPSEDYQVKFLPFAEDDAEFSDQYQGNDPTKDSDANPATGMTGVFEVGVSDIVTNLDVGMVVAANREREGVQLQFQKASYYYIKLVLTAGVAPNIQTSTIGPVLISALSAQDARAIVKYATFKAGWHSVDSGDSRLVILGKGNPGDYVNIVSCDYSIYAPPGSDANASTAPRVTSLGIAEVTGGFQNGAPPAASDAARAVFLSFIDTLGYSLTVTIATVGNQTYSNTTPIAVSGSTPTAIRNNMLSDLQDAFGSSWTMSSLGDGAIRIDGKTTNNVLDPVASVKVTRSYVDGAGLRLTAMGGATATRRLGDSKLRSHT